MDNIWEVYMLRELVDDLYLNQNYNCGECILRAANQAYGFGLDEKGLKLASGFGAGMGCGNTCGALSAAISALSMLYCGDKAHETDGFKELCAEFVAEFKKALGSDNCEDLKKLYRYPDGDDRRCLITIEKAADVLEQFISRTNGEAAAEEVTVKPEDIKRVKGMGFLHNKGTNKFNGRVITVNGKITAAQAKCIAEAADLYGNGEIALTTRLTEEVIGIPYDKIPDFQAYIAKAGLETGGTGSKVRPVVSCKGTTCQYGLIDTYALSEKLHYLFYKGYRGLNLPHKFKIAVGGCPNNCVKPDLNDLGIIGQRVPTLDTELCKGCKKCQIEAACPVKAATVVDDKLYIDPAKCNHCGRCVQKCPFHAVDDSTYGYAVVIGGRWGKRYAHGQRLTKIFTSEEEVISVVEKAILFFAEQGISGERFSDTIARIGFEKVNAELLSDDILTRKDAIVGKALTAKGGATC